MNYIILISLAPRPSPAPVFAAFFCITDQKHGAGEGLGTRLILIGLVFTDLCRDLQKTIASQPAAAPPRQPEYQQPKGVGKEGGGEEEGRKRVGEGEGRRKGSGGKKERGGVGCHSLY